MTAERLIRELRGMLSDAGLSGSFLVRDLSNGDEIGIDPDIEYPIASLVKVPLAVAVLDRIRDGRIDGATLIDVQPSRIPAAGQTGLSKFRHPARIAVDDLLYLSTAISDNVAAELLLDLVTPADVNRAMREAGITGITIRHTMRDLIETPAERIEPGNVRLAHSLAIGSRTSGRGHAVAQLDVSRTNSGTASAFADLLEALWIPSRIPDGVAAQVRVLMAENVIRHRLTPDFSSDASKWSAKTGTLLNERHEIGVVEHDDGGLFAVAALTESTVPAAIQPAAEALMAHVARALHDYLRAQ